jgi:hypothetical protein
MKFGPISAIMVAGTMLCGVTQADAGYWNYGCKGALGDRAIMFDRMTLLIMPRELAKGELTGLMKGYITNFNAADENSGLVRVMKFESSLNPDQKVVLTEKSSKSISVEKGKIGTRDRSKMLDRKTYHFERTDGDEPRQADIVMDCIEYEVTAP